MHFYFYLYLIIYILLFGSIIYYIYLCAVIIKK